MGYGKNGAPQLAACVRPLPEVQLRPRAVRRSGATIEDQAEAQIQPCLRRRDLGRRGRRQRRADRARRKRRFDLPPRSRRGTGRRPSAPAASSSDCAPVTAGMSAAFGELAATGCDGRDATPSQRRQRLRRGRASPAGAPRPAAARAHRLGASWRRCSSSSWCSCSCRSSLRLLLEHPGRRADHRLRRSSASTTSSSCRAGRRRDADPEHAAASLRSRSRRPSSSRSGSRCCSPGSSAARPLYRFLIYFPALVPGRRRRPHLDLPHQRRLRAVQHAPAAGRRRARDLAGPRARRLPVLAALDVWRSIGFWAIFFLAALMACHRSSTTRPSSTARARGSASGA